MADTRVAILFWVLSTVYIQAYKRSYLEGRQNGLDWLDVIEASKDEDTEIVMNSYEPGYVSFEVNPEVTMVGRLMIANKGLGSDYSYRKMKDSLSTYIDKRRMKPRKKELSFPIRERPFISRYQSKYFPYSNIVHLSTGCTGTLLTPYHVLSAAHCVHNGNRYKRNIEMLKVEVPEMIGSRLYYVVDIKVPVMWTKTQTLPEAARGAYDYAVLKLNLPVRGRNTFMYLSVPEMSTMNSDLQLLSFSSNRPHRLVQTTCHPDDNLIVMKGNVLLTTCDAAGRGSSGSAVFTNNGREGSTIIGVLSNTITTTSGDMEFDAIMLLTLQKCLDICTMIHPEGCVFNSCGDIKSGYR